MVTVISVPVEEGWGVGVGDALGVFSASETVDVPVGDSLGAVDPGRADPVAHPESGIMITSRPRITRRTREDR